MLNQERQLKETSFSFSTGVALGQFEAFLLEDGPAKRSSVPRPLGNSLVPNQDDTLWSQGDPQLFGDSELFLSAFRPLLPRPVRRGSTRELPPAPRATASPVFGSTNAVASTL